MSWIDALEQGTMYADAYDEAIRAFEIERTWRLFVPDPDQKITIRRPVRQTEAP